MTRTITLGWLTVGLASLLLVADGMRVPKESSEADSIRFIGLKQLISQMQHLQLQQPFSKSGKMPSSSQQREEDEEEDAALESLSSICNQLNNGNVLVSSVTNLERLQRTWGPGDSLRASPVNSLCPLTPNNSSNTELSSTAREHLYCNVPARK